MKKTVLSLMVLCGMLAVCGCFTKATAYTTKTTADGLVTESYVSIIGTGDKVSQVAAEGLFADGTDEDLGSGVKKASASQQSTGIEGTLAGMGTLMTGMAQFMTAAQGVKAPVAVKTPAAVEETQPESQAETIATSAPPAVTAVANAAPLNAKIAEAKASGKPLVVLAGIPGCGYCTQMEAVIAGTPAFLARTDIVFYSEKTPIAQNAAAQWTGGGLAPVLRVTQWDTAGKIVCDKRVERPQSMADIYAAMNACSIHK